MIYVIFIIAGIVLRFLFPGDVEWKYDHAWMFYHSIDVAKTMDWPMIGMKSGGGIVNPALGLWIFSILAFVFKNPVTMTMAVAVLNSLALLFLLYFSLKMKKLQGEVLLKTAALASVSPLALLFSRSIWAQNLLPFFVCFFLLGAIFRDRKWGGFLLGLVGASLGQIHMPGFFYVFGFIVFIYFMDFRKKNKTQFKFWLLGSIIGALPLIPWVIHLLEQPKIIAPPDSNNSGTIEFKHIFKFRFYTYMLLDSLGIHLKYIMNKEFWEFMKFPFNSYLVSMLHVIAGGIGLFVLVDWVRKLVKRIKIFTGPLDFLMLASWIGGGGALTLMGLKMHPHYIIVAFPFSYYWMIRLLEDKKEWLTKLFITSQFFISLSFLSYVHINDGILNGNYRKTYEAQINSGDFDLELDSTRYHLKMIH